MQYMHTQTHIMYIQVYIYRSYKCLLHLGVCAKWISGTLISTIKQTIYATKSLYLSGFGVFYIKTLLWIQINNNNVLLRKAMTKA